MKIKKEDLACVIVTSYNHEKYIKKAINSILLQKTNFPFKIYLADDCSTDKTRKILDYYSQKYPNKIKKMYTTKNIGMVANMKNAFNKTQSKYIFILEGDDYWCSPFKMQKQVNLLEENIEYSLVINRILVKNEITGKIYFNGNINDQWSIRNSSIHYLTTESLIKNQIATNFSSYCFRRESLIKLDKNVFKEKIWDWLFSILMSTVGVVVYINEPMSVYRVSITSQWNKKTDIEKKDDLLKNILKYNKLLKFKYTKEFTELEHLIKSKKSAVFYKKVVKLITPPVIIKIINKIRNA